MAERVPITADIKLIAQAETSEARRQRAVIAILDQIRTTGFCDVENIIERWDELTTAELKGETLTAERQLDIDHIRETMAKNFGYDGTARILRAWYDPNVARQRLHAKAHEAAVETTH